MGKPTLAFVNFFREPRGRRVVEVKDIINPDDEDHGVGWPKHLSDFQPNHIYQVRWPHMPVEGSFSTTSEYDAHILCFGVSVEDLTHELRETGLKIPSTDIDKYKHHGQPASKKSPATKTSSRGRKLRQPKSTQVVAAPCSHAKKKKKSTDEDITRRERNRDFIKAVDLPFPAENSNNEQTSKLLVKGNIIAAQKARKEARGNSTLKAGLSEGSSTSLRDDFVQDKHTASNNQPEIKTVKGCIGSPPLKVRTESKSGGSKLKADLLGSFSLRDDLADDVHTVSNNKKLDRKTVKESNGGHPLKPKKDSSKLKAVASLEGTLPSRPNSDMVLHDCQNVSDNEKLDRKTFKGSNSGHPLKPKKDSSKLKAVASLEGTLPSRSNSDMLSHDCQNVSDNEKPDRKTVKASNSGLPLKARKESSKLKAISSLEGNLPSRSNSDMLSHDFQTVSDKELDKTVKRSNSVPPLKVRRESIGGQKLKAGLSYEHGSLPSFSVSDMQAHDSQTVLDNEVDDMTYSADGKGSNSAVIKERKSNLMKSPLKEKKSKVKKRRRDYDTSSSSEESESLISSTDAAKAQIDFYVSKILRLESEVKLLKRENLTLKERGSVSCSSNLHSSHATPSQSSEPKAKAKRSLFNSCASSPDKCDYVDNTTISAMIMDAVENRTPLRKDGTGKVHLGNGVYVTSNLFYEKLMVSKVSPSIATRDLISSIYSTKELAERSLEGGTPVRGGIDKKKLKKKKLTPAKRECFLGLFRAKTQLKTGSSDSHFLNLSVEKQGKSTLRDKLKEAAMKIRKEAEKVVEAQQNPESEERTAEVEDRVVDHAAHNQDEQDSDGTDDQDHNTDSDTRLQETDTDDE